MCKVLLRGRHTSLVFAPAASPVADFLRAQRKIVD
jgi:hypothetical protein